MRTKKVNTPDRKKEFLNEFGGPQKWGNYKDLVWTVIMTAAENSLSWREQEILREVLALRPFEQLAVEFNISPERVRQIFRLALRRVVSFRHTITTDISAYKKEITLLKSENGRLKDEVFRLAHQELTDDPSTKEADNLLYRYGEPFSTSVNDCGFSVRLWNCLRTMDIMTVGDIVSFKRTEYMRIHNLGKKTLDELDTFLDVHHLSYAMWTNPDRPKMYD